MRIIANRVMAARGAARPASMQRALRDALRLAIWLTGALILTGCQAFARPAATPALTPVLLLPATAPAPATKSPAAPTVVRSDAPSPTAAPAAATPEADDATVRHTPRIMALGLSSAVVLRAAPQASAAAVAQVPGSEVLKAVGRSADGRWLWVAYGENEASSAWVAAAAVKLLGDPAALPVVDKTAVAPTRAAPAAAGRPAPQPAAPTKLAGKIALMTVAGGDIYLVNADGSGLRRVAVGIDPALSPDGARLAYTRWSPPSCVLVLDLATGEERCVASANRPRSPTWSPDGGKLAFIHQTRYYNCLETPLGCFTEAQIREFFGGQDCQVIQGQRYCISDFSVSIGREYAVARVDAESGGWLDISSTIDVQSLSWRPQQAEILYRGGGGLQIAAADAAPRPLVQDAGLGSPAWSPDGQRIAAQVHMHDHADLFLLDAAGQKLARLTAPPAGGAAPNNVAPAWSPDGKFILFLSDRDGAWRLYRMNADGSGQALFLPQVLGSIALKYDFAAERMVSWSK